MVDLATFLIFLAVLAGAAFTNLSPVLFVVVAGALGIVLRALGLDGASRKEAVKK